MANNSHPIFYFPIHSFISLGATSYWGGALSLISLPIERAPPLHTIYLDLLVFVYCIDFRVSLY